MTLVVVLGYLAVAGLGLTILDDHLVPIVTAALVLTGLVLMFTPRKD